MKSYLVIATLSAFALTACGETAETEPAAAQTAAAPTAEASLDAPAELPAPRQDLFAEVFAKSCPDAEPVSNAVCRRSLGADEVSCEFGLGEDNYLRHKAQLAVNETGDGWMLADAAKICAEHDSHHADS